MIYTYVLQSKKDGRWYTGATEDLRKRLIEHNSNLVQSTKSRGPFEVIYYEACLDEHDAFIREQYLKFGPGIRYLKNRLKRFLSLPGQANDRVHPVRGRSRGVTVGSNGGFTLIEILVVTAILLILAGIGLFVTMDAFRG